MKPITGIDLCSRLEQSGWVLKRFRGGHHIYGKTGERKLIVVPVQGNREIKPGLASRIAKDAGISW